MGKGGVLGAFVMCEFAGGTSKSFPSGDKESSKNKKKSSLVYVKEPIAKFFGFPEANLARIQELRKRTVKTKINGKEETIQTSVRVGTTGASRSVRIRFTALQSIGGKSVASVNLAMPTSFTFGDMVKFLSLNKEKSNVIASIISPDGSAVTFRTPYSPKKKVGK